MLVAWVVTLYPLNMPKMDFTSMVNPYLYTVVPVVPYLVLRWCRRPFSGRTVQQGTIVHIQGMHGENHSFTKYKHKMKSKMGEIWGGHKRGGAFL